MHSSQWLTVDKDGLARILGRKTKDFAIMELVQNAWDATGVTECKVECSYANGLISVTVSDNSPVGFPDLSHAYTLFATSEKTTDPLRRGRFNAGEKLVLALCSKASVRTTSGTVEFSKSGRKVSKAHTDTGSIITCILPGTEVEFQTILQSTAKLIVPENIKTFVNGKLLPNRQAETSFEARLVTEAANAAGVLRPVERKTSIGLYACLEGETAYLYEMGIPIMETGDRWHYDVGQKIPLTIDREAVTPSFLKNLRLVTFNNTYPLLSAEDCNSTWVHEAIGHKACLPAAVESYLSKRFTEKRVSFDPSDPEANKLAVSKGYVVVTGNMMSRDAWRNAREASAILPAGQVTPSPKPYDPNGLPMKLLKELTPEMERVKLYSHKLAYLLLGSNIHITFANDPGWFPLATYGPGQLVFNVGKLGRSWFSLVNLPVDRQRINELLIHEFAHHYVSDHLSSEYYDMLCKLGAQMVEAAIAGTLPSI